MYEMNCAGPRLEPWWGTTDVNVRLHGYLIKRPSHACPRYIAQSALLEANAAANGGREILYLHPSKPLNQFECRFKNLCHVRQGSQFATCGLNPLTR